MMAQGTLGPQGAVLRLLLVEDDEDDYILTRSVLHQVDGRPFELDWVKSYEEAVRALEKVDYDLCLVDYMLGEQDGLAVLRYVAGRTRSPPLVLLTATRRWRNSSAG